MSVCKGEITDPSSPPDAHEIENGLKEIQNHICEFLVNHTGQKYVEDLWNYAKGDGGGITRVWTGDISSSGNVTLEKGAVNFSSITGKQLPSNSMADQLHVPLSSSFRAIGISLILHPLSPLVPTIHMNLRYFQVKVLDSSSTIWWFGGGIDLTPFHPDKRGIIRFHKELKKICESHSQDYDALKKECDNYFYIPHRNERRGVGGIFFDHLGSLSEASTSVSHLSKESLWMFVTDLGMSFPRIYEPFLSCSTFFYTPTQRKLQLLRRGRYVEFNLVYDRGTRFGLQSEGRIESILVSLPPLAAWQYNWKLPSSEIVKTSSDTSTTVNSTDENSLRQSLEDSNMKDDIENLFSSFYLQPQDWAYMELSE